MTVALCLSWALMSVAVGLFLADVILWWKREAGPSVSARCVSCGFVQGELNWCRRCGHRTIWARGNGRSVTPGETT